MTVDRQASEPIGESLRDRILVALAVLSVLAALAAVFGAVLHRGASARAEDSHSETDSPAATVSRADTRPARVSDESLVEPSRDPRADGPAWTPVPLPEGDTVGTTKDPNEGSAAALKKCCESLRAVFKRAAPGEGGPAQACDRLTTLVSSRSATSDALAAAALDGIRGALARQPKGFNVPAACK
ncbi:MAG TPA: hypothetical protein VF881_02465 [Polyangiaceae bacterium]